MGKQKRCVGIDISKSTFTACICDSAGSNSLVYSDIRHFKNERNGFNQLLRWVRKTSKTDSELVFLMEATGVYYENLAHFLYKLKQTVHVVLPNTSKHYFLSLNVKTKTDEIDAKVLSQFGVERSHKPWRAPNDTLLELRNLTRYYVQLQEQKTALNNIKHSKEHAHHVQKFILKSNKSLITQIDKQIIACKTQIEEQINSDENLKKKVQNLLSVKGVGLITVATIIAETLGFMHIRNRKQLASYSGYDVVQRESGTSIKGKTRISKKGNRYIRKSLYFPAMVACRYNPELKEKYQRIIAKKPSKMIGQVAIQRKLLLLMFTLWKNNTEYQQDYNKLAPGIKPEAKRDIDIQMEAIPC